MATLADNVTVTMECLDAFGAEIQSLGLIKQYNLQFSIQTDLPESLGKPSFLLCLKNFIFRLKKILEPSSLAANEAYDQLCDDGVNIHEENVFGLSNDSVQSYDLESQNSRAVKPIIYPAANPHYANPNEVLNSLSALKLDSPNDAENSTSTSSLDHNTLSAGKTTEGRNNDLQAFSNTNSTIFAGVAPGKECTKDGTKSQSDKTANSCLKSKARKKKPGAANSHPCQKCHRVFRKWRHLSYHCQKVHKDNEDIESAFDETAAKDLPVFCCKTCNVACNDFQQFQKHLCKLPDEEADGVFPSVKNKILITNEEKLREMKKFVCHICDIEFRSFQRIVYHLPRCLPGPYPCNTCADVYPSQRELNYHKKKNHKGVKCFSCDECSKGFLRKASLRKHSIYWHESRWAPQGHCVPFKCDMCHKKFIKRIYLTNHKLRTHGLDKKFLCQICGHKFMSKNSLTVHIKTHGEEAKKFECHFCQKRFTKKEKMQHHERIHTGERPFQCLECSKTFISKGRLSDHQRRHTGEKRYPCPLCPKSYAAGWDLKKHTRKVHNKRLDAVPVMVIPNQVSQVLEREQLHAPNQVITIAGVHIPLIQRLPVKPITHYEQILQTQLTEPNDAFGEPFVSADGLIRPGQFGSPLRLPVDYTVHAPQQHSLQAVNLSDLHADYAMSIQ